MLMTVQILHGIPCQEIHVLGNLDALDAFATLALGGYGIVVWWVVY